VGGRLGLFCSRFMEAGWLLLAAAIPLYFNLWTYNVFELNKVVLFRSLVLLILGGWLIRIWEEGWPPVSKPSPLTLAVLAFTAIYILATITSLNPRLSLLGSYERQEGTYTTLSYIALFFIVLCNLERRAQVERLITVILWGSLPVALYGVIQYLGLDPILWEVDAPSPVHSTLGRSNFLAAYLVMVMPLTMGRFSLVTGKGKAGYGFLLLLQALCLLFTEARGPWLGFLAAVFTFFLLLGLRRGIGWLWVGTAWTGVLVLILLALLNLPQMPLPGLSRLPYLSRLATLSETGAGSTAARLTIWRASLHLIASRPLLGYGPDTFGLVFSRFFPPQLVYYQGRGVLVDRAHNGLLDLAATAGLLGLLAYLSLLFLFFSRALRGLWEAADPWRQTTLIACLSTLLGYLVQEQFGFGVSTLFVFFWLLLAVTTKVAEGRLTSPVDEEKGRWLRKVGGWQKGLLYSSLLGLFSFLVVTTNIFPLLADLHHRRGRVSRDFGGLEASIQADRRAVALWPWEPAYHLSLGWSYLEGAKASPDRLPWLASSLSELKEAIRLSPQDVNLWVALGQLYHYWAIAADSAKFAPAHEAYEEAVRLAPNTARVYTYWGLVYYDQGRYEEAAKSFRYATDLDATDGYAYSHLGDAYLVLGELGPASVAYSNAIKWEPHLYHAHRGLGKVYYKQGRFREALVEYQRSLEIEPNNVEAYQNMARAYVQLGRKEEAISTLQRALELEPENRALQDLLEQVRTRE